MTHTTSSRTPFVHRLKGERRLLNERFCSTKIFGIPSAFRNTYNSCPFSASFWSRFVLLSVVSSVFSYLFCLFSSSTGYYPCVSYAIVNVAVIVAWRVRAREFQPKKKKKTLSTRRRHLIIIRKIENFWISCDSNDIWQHYVLELDNTISNANGVRAPYLHTKRKAKGRKRRLSSLVVDAPDVACGSSSAYIFRFNVILHLLFI